MLSSVVLAAVSAAAAPVLMIIAALLAAWPSLQARRKAALASFLGLAALGSAGLMAGAIFLGGRQVVPVLGSGMLRLDLYLDPLTAIMLLLVSFLGAVVLRYSRNYLDGEPRQGRFIGWLCLTIGAVMTLLISGNLLMFALAWMATSLSLHQLLTFYPERRAGLLAARQKFLISRLGDACLAGALVLTWQCFGTWEFEKLFASAAQASASAHSGCLTGASLLLVAGALLKSAQFPFHGWLPDTMETPTPVSALMHAGIINAGGFLVVRLSPIIATSPTALNLLALVGSFTALFASVVMLTQTSIKRSLAYSTVAQMGFMMLQCGLGAFALAVLHIVAHSLYKAHAFLSSGSIITMSRSAWVPSGRPSGHPLLLVVILGTAVLISVMNACLFGVQGHEMLGALLLGTLFTMGLCYLLWNLWSSSHRAGLVVQGLVLSFGVSAAYYGLHQLFHHWLASSVAAYAPQRTAAEYAILILVGLLFLAVLIFQSQMPVWSSTRWGRWLYVHSSHGFYLGSLANRFTQQFFGKVAP